MDYDIEIDGCGNKFYYINNVLHREDGPAIEFTSGNKHWYKYGKLHRENGPAVEDADGYKGWYLNDEFYGYDDKFTNESWTRFIKTLIFS